MKQAYRTSQSWKRTWLLALLALGGLCIVAIVDAFAAEHGAVAGLFCGVGLMCWPSVVLFALALASVSNR
jgi:hypothetical protein